MSKPHILFVCTGNSCRSQMAEGWARYLGGDKVEVESAGVSPHGKNPRAIAIMQTAGVDISHQESTLLTDEMIARSTLVITVCGHADEICPMMPPGVEKRHWPLEDPAKATGTEEEIMAIFKASCEDIQQRVKQLLIELGVL